MQGTLLLAILTVKSSYADEIERPLENDDDVPDTLQWWFGESGVWRIRTYAIDKDIHTHVADSTPERALPIAKLNNQKHYGDIIRAEHLIAFLDCRNAAEVGAEFKRIGLVPRLECAVGRYAFWKPDDAVYSSKSEPK